MKQILELPSENISKNQLILLISLAYIFSIFIRLIWVYQFNDTESFYWNNQLMINTNDGYFFASGAQKVLEEIHRILKPDGIALVTLDEKIEDLDESRVIHTLDTNKLLQT